MAVRVTVSPALSDAVVLSRVTLVTAITFFETEITQVAVLSPALAVMMAEPSLIAFTLPVLSTVATSLLLLLHVTVLSVASTGSTVAVS